MTLLFILKLQRFEEGGGEGEEEGGKGEGGRRGGRKRGGFFERRNNVQRFGQLILCFIYIYIYIYI